MFGAQEKPARTRRKMRAGRPLELLAQIRLPKSKRISAKGRYYCLHYKTWPVNEKFQSPLPVVERVIQRGLVLLQAPELNL